MDPVQFAKENWAVISQAPWVFVTEAALVGAIAFMFGRFFRGEKIANLESRIALKDDRISEYERKLDGASPDEAAQQFAALERRLDSLISVPIEELQRGLQHSEAAARQKKIQQLIDQFRQAHGERPSEKWINDQLEQLGVAWRAVHKGTHYETFEPARWA